MRHALTDTFIQSIKPPASGRVEISDLRSIGLELRITAGKAASWSFRFRDPESGKPTRFTIGTYPEISLAKAREYAGELRKQVAAGSNPVADKRQRREDAATKTFGALADRYLARHARPHKRSAEADDRNLKLHVRPKWGRRRYDRITRSEVIELLDGIVDAGKPTLANRIQALVSKIYSFALDEGIVSTHPCARLPKRGAERVGNRVLSDGEIRLFWSRIVHPPVSSRVGLALRLALLTGTRTVEVAQATRGELHEIHDSKQAAWIVPGDRTKNKRDHLIPLSELALQTVKDAFEAVGEADYLFPSPYIPERPITSHALAVAMDRFAENLEGEDEAIKTWRADPPSPHDLRRTFGTRLASFGVPQEDRDALLNHTPVGVNKKHYDRYDRAREKRRALDAWSATLSRILSGDTSSPVVVPLKRA